jgi:hypothetical protein
MSEDRIKELQDFSDDFKRRLKHAKERYEKSLSKSSELDNSQKKENSNNFNVINKSHRIIKHKNRYVN